ncbi:putative protoheme IX farnesyltransferase, partial [Bordetella bronchiseptica E014]
MSSLAAPQTGLLRQYLVLTKPRVTQLAVFCAVIGMFLAAPGMPDLSHVVFGTLGIWLLAAAAFAINCLIEQEVDARMLRTARRATARGTISDIQVLSLSGLLGGAGMLVLYHLVNPLTMWLTFATFVGYAIIYTVILKPRTPQNIVIGGLSGAMPPALGWAAVADSVPAEAWVLVLIIFIWTPPHFWALALYRNNDYIKAGLPMLRLLQRELQAGLALEGRLDAIGAVPDHHDDARRLQLPRAADDVIEHGPAGQGMQHLGKIGLHALAQSGGEYHYIKHRNLRYPKSVNAKVRQAR